MLVCRCRLVLRYLLLRRCLLRHGRFTSVTKKATSKKKVSQNQSTPTNQHGTNNSPKKAKSARTESGLYSRLHDSLEAAQMSDDLGRWPELSARVIEIAK